MGNALNLSTKHLFLALFTVLIWGLNFIAIHYGLNGFPPLLLCAVRFGLAALPWVFILPRPKAPVKYIVGYGIFTFVMQFGLLFSGIYMGLSTGLASLVLQVQVFFSMGLAAFFFTDKPGIWKICGSLISFAGIGIVAFHMGDSASLIGLVLTVLAALSWSAGNMFSKKVDAESPLSLVVWGNLVAFPFMVGLSFFIEGPERIVSSLQNISLPTVLAILYIVYLSTHVGYGIWGYLLNSYATAAVVPFTLLIPVIGFVSAALILNEPLPFWKIGASIFVMVGLVFNLLEKYILKAARRLKPKVKSTPS
ncbi:EamA family transporter [Niabella sp. W65]|nr:EamA family transporter [Niabella sp. W65]MCH7366278.1 EamA family transporter [Niabella sp. W65]